MDKTNDISINDYTRIATLNKNPASKVDVYIATLATSKPNDFFIINSFEHCKSNQNIFKDFFFLVHNDKCPHDVVNLLTDEKHFYIVFHYQNNSNINDLFTGDKNTANYEQRCSMLDKIFLAISKIDMFPIPALSCCTDLDNICIDKNNDIMFCYNFEKYYDYLSTNFAHVYDNIYKIISMMLSNELKDNKIPFTGFYNKPYKVVLQKCKNQLYQSIPEFIIDFQKAEKLCDVTDTASAAKKFIDKKKSRWKKYANGFMIILIIAAIVIFFQPLFVNKNVPSQAVASIGIITYNKTAADMELLVIGSEPEESSVPFDFSTISIPANADILYEEYVVQYGQTIASICESYYHNVNLLNAVKSFNNIQNPDNLSAGSILKLPSGSVIEKFITTSSAQSSNINISSLGSSIPSSSSSNISSAKASENTSTSSVSSINFIY